MNKTNSILTDEFKDLTGYYRRQIEINGDFNWVNSLYKVTSQTLINLNNTSVLNLKDVEFLQSLNNYLANNNLPEEDHSEDEKDLKSEISKLNSNLTADKKFLRNKTVNTRKRNKLGLLIQYEVESSKNLQTNFELKNGMTLGHLYRIDVLKIKKNENSADISKNDCNSNDSNSLININSINSNHRLKSRQTTSSLAILTAVPLVETMTFPILNSEKKEPSVELVKIEFLKKVRINKTLFEKILTFHHQLFSDLCSYKEIETPLLERLLDDSSQERKYLLLPIRKDEKSVWKIAEKKIQQAVEFNSKKQSTGNSMKKIIEAEMKKVKKNVGITLEKAKENIKAKINKRVFYTTYKHLLYEIDDLFYSKDSAEILLQKVADSQCQILEEGNDSNVIKEMLKTKYFNSLTEEDFKQMSSKELILKAPTQSMSINGFRKISESNDINVDFDEVAFAYGKSLKSIFNFDYTYNKQQQANGHKKSKAKDVAIHGIFPIEYLNTYFLKRKDYKLAARLPTILLNFERRLLPIDFCSNYLPDLEADPTVIEKILHATTAPSVMEDFDFESLETLGDSIIKIILTVLLYYKYPGESEGYLQSERREMLKNDKLQEVGINNQLYKFVLMHPFKVTNWEPPMKRNLEMKFEQSITKKAVADILEALVGVCFMINKDMATSFKFMEKVGIIPKDLIIDEALTLTKLFARNDKDNKNWNNSELQENFSVFTDYTIIELFFSNKNSSNFVVNPPFSDPLTFIESGLPNKKALKLLQEKINYKFKNTSLLITAFTHQSIIKEAGKNYQRLELLGDAVLEIYLLIRLFLIFEDKIFDSVERKLESVSTANSKDNMIFNCGNITHAKSLLVSNNFLIKLSVLLNLQQFIVISDKNTIDSIENFFDAENIQVLLRSKINEYEDDPNNCSKPKILSDVFEALLGAILIDSNIDSCFEFLDEVYTPFLLYTSANFGEIKYSPVSEFIEICHKKFGVGPRFSRLETKEKMIEVSAWAGDVLVSKGTAANEDRAKEIAAIEGIKYLNISTTITTAV